MNNIMKIAMVTCVVLSYSSIANQPVKSSKQAKKVEAKCHVELFGGNETIYFRMINSEDLSKLANRVINRKILTTFSGEKKKIYKVHECVYATASFTLTKSQNIDKRMMR
jgi:hypothetical protein